MNRVFNFSAGPAMLPQEVLERAQKEMLDWGGNGTSVMEISHRGKEFMALATQSEETLRGLLSIPANYEVLFLQGGASLQFSMIPHNLMRGKADYLNTGVWSKKAIAAAKGYGVVNVAASSENTKFTSIPAPETWDLDPQASYVHYTPNETIGGVEFHFIPETGEVPLVADMSSTLLSRPIEVSRYGLIYAGAQKNIGPAGLTIVIVRKDLLGHAITSGPLMLDYKIHAENQSMYNTPPTYSWYIASLVFEWLEKNGGLVAMAEVNRKKSEKLYSYIDGSGFYKNPVELSCRSWMNVPFTLPRTEMDIDFLEGAKKVSLLALKGHKLVGGMRASLYNAMPETGVDALIEYMKAFSARHGEG